MILLDRIGNEITEGCIVEHKDFLGHGSTEDMSITHIDINASKLTLKHLSSGKLYTDIIHPTGVFMYLIVKDSYSNFGKGYTA